MEGGAPMPGLEEEREVGVEAGLNWPRKGGKGDWLRWGGNGDKQKGDGE